MVLLLVTHLVEVPSSRVPLAVIILTDAIKRRTLPPNLKCRMVIPSSGNYSASMWDASSIEELQAWIDANLMDGIAHIAEIPEDFTYGLALELTTSRAADKVASSSKTTLDRINTTGARVMETMVEKLDRLDQRTHLITATREATSAAVGKVREATDRALENEGVQKSLASISSSFQSASNRMGRAFSWVGSKVKEQFPATTPNGSQSYTPFSTEDHGSPPDYNPVYSAPNYMPVSTNAARPSDAPEVAVGGGAWGTGAGAPVDDPAPMPQFTLDEGFGSPHQTPTKDADLAPERTAGSAAAAPEEEQPVKESTPLVRSPQGEHLPPSAPAPVL